MPPPATMISASPSSAAPATRPSASVAGQVDRQHAERKRVVAARGEGRVDQEARRSGGAAEQADRDPAGGAHPCRLRAALERDPGADAEEAGEPAVAPR